MSRTTWAEEQAAAMCAFPLTAETVFLRVKYQKGGEKEVCDLLLALRGTSIVLSLKHQDDPERRTGDALERWCGKAAKNAARQLNGAVKTISARPFWCDHPRRGRVDVAAADLAVAHAIALVETLEPVMLPDDLPDHARGVAVTYLSSNDLINLVQELRSFPDLVAYLDARLGLPADVRRTIGNEKVLFGYYVLNGETFDGCRSAADLKAQVAAGQDELDRRIVQKKKEDFFAMVIEHVSDALAERAPDYALGLRPETLAKFDSDANRTKYMILQEHLCDLALGARRILGEAFLRLRKRVIERNGDLTYQSFSADTKPGFLYVVASARGLDKQTILDRAELLLLAGLAHYGKDDGMVIVDRDGKGYEVILIGVATHTPEAVAAGEVLFGKSKITHIPIKLLPD